MNEAETRAELIDPALNKLGWKSQDNIKVSREYEIDRGRILAGGKSAKKKVADYLLTVNDQDLAVIEAKSENTWTIDIKNINQDTFDLGVVNPNIEEEVLPEPSEILKDIDELENDSKNLLKELKKLI